MKFKLWYMIIGLIIVFAVIVLISENARKSTEGQTECSTGSMCITTDKVKYVQGEVIKITIKNNLNSSLTNYDNSNDNLNGTPFYSLPVGWGFIEKLENKEWIKIEPLWRCGERCWEKCDLNSWFFILGPNGTTNFPKDSRSFEWNQMQLICDLNLSNIKREFVGMGIFRVSSIFLDESKNILETFYSNEFEIKEIKCSIDPDCKDLDCSTEEKPEPQPECVNNTCKCTYSHCKEVGGCM